MLLLVAKFMSVAEFKLDFSVNTVLWYDKSMSFHARSYFNNACLIEECTTNEPFAIAEAYNIQSSRTAYVDSAAKYKETDLIKLAYDQAHLSIETRSELQTMLVCESKLFQSLEGKTLEIFPDREFYIELVPGAVPFHVKQPYSIPLHQRNAVKKELICQLGLGIITRCYAQVIADV